MTDATNNEYLDLDDSTSDIDYQLDYMSNQYRYGGDA